MRLLIILACLVGMLCLQIYLCQKKSKWIGLALPAISFIMSFVWSFNRITYHDSSAMSIGGAIAIWLLYNIPTVILLLIYFTCRDRNYRKKQIEKMNIQDLN